MRAGLRLLAGRRGALLVVTLLFLIKSFLATFAFFSFEFSYVPQLLANGILTINNTPWGMLTYGIEGFWLSLPIHHPPISQIWQGPPRSLPPTQYLLVFLLKLPILLSDVITGALIYLIVRRLTGDPSKGFKAFLLWYANPYNIVAIAMLGAFDIIALLFLMTAVWLLLARRPFYASMPALAATSLMIYPLLSLPPLILYSVKFLRNRKGALVMAITGVVGGIALFWWVRNIYPSPLLALVRYSPLNQPILDEFVVKIFERTIGFATVTLFIVILCQIYYWSWDDRALVAGILAIFSAEVGFTNWHIQTLIWPLAFLTILVSAYGSKRFYLVAIPFVGFLWILFRYAVDVVRAGISLFFMPILNPAMQNISNAISAFVANGFLNLTFWPIVESVFVGLMLLLLIEIMLEAISLPTPHKNDFKEASHSRDQHNPKAKGGGP